MSEGDRPAPGSLEAILRPRSVAVIGASDAPGRIGGRPISSMLKTGYRGRILPVNPKYEQVQGLRAYASIGEVPGPVDCAIVAVPAAAAVGVVRDCAAAGVRGAVLFTSGFAEIDGAGARAQEEIGRIAREAGMRVLGPNCLGVLDTRESWYGTFANAPGMGPLTPGPVGMVSQSGAYGTHMFMVAQARGIGVRSWVTTGNEVDVDVAEVIEHFARDPETRVIAAYSEGVRDAVRLRRALDAAREAETPVIFMKVGRTEVGAAAAASHTASLAGRDALYDALFAQYGVFRAETTAQMVDVVHACQFGRFPKGRRVALQSISGGVGVQMADAAVGAGLDVPPLPEAVQAELKALLPFAGVRNPIDFTAQALNEPDLMTRNVALTIEQGGFDAHVVYLASVPASPFTAEATHAIFAELRRRYPDEIMVASLIGPPDIVARWEAMGLPVYEDPAHAVQALAALTRFGETFARGRPQAPPTPPEGARRPPPRAVAEHDAKAVLGSWGVPVTRDVLARDEAEAVAAWREIGGPVVLKIASPDIAHKTEIGGVMVGVDGEESVAQGFATLTRRAAKRRPDARLDGVIVAEMATGGVETVMGVVRDPVFGPAVMFGLGGVFVEVLGDVAFRLAPFGEDEARRMIDSIRGRAVLDGVRGAPPSDVGALARALAALSVFAHETEGVVESVDLNPVLARPDGCVALDALIVPRGGAT